MRTLLNSTRRLAMQTGLTYFPALVAFAVRATRASARTLALKHTQTAGRQR
jgi:hypothetical protein